MTKERLKETHDSIYLQLEELEGSTFNELLLKCIKLIIENQQLKDKINTYEDPEDLTLIFMYCEEKAKDKIKQLQNNWNELNEFLEKEKERLVKECSNHYTDSFDKYHAVNEDIYDELIKVTDKMQELEGNND